MQSESPVVNASKDSNVMRYSRVETGLISCPESETAAKYSRETKPGTQKSRSTRIFDRPES
jgi:hypothetical protein